MTHTSGGHLGVDSQAEILSIRHGRGMPGQYLLDGFHKQLVAVHQKHAGIDIELRWMPGHVGIAGNEQGDEEAKREAWGNSSLQWQMPVSCRKVLPTSQSAMQQSHMKKVNVKLKKCFKSAPICHQLHWINTSTLSPKFRKDTLNIESWQVLMLIQLRTRHLPLLKLY